MTGPDPSDFPDLQPIIAEALRDVFERMLQLDVAPAPAGAGAVLPERVVGLVALGGDRLSGSLFLQFSPDFAQRMAAAMLGDSPDAPATESDVNDVISEISNMVGGAVKSKLSDTVAPCAISTPSIIRGTAFAVEADPDLRKEVFPFESAGQRFFAELHFKFL